MMIDNQNTVIAGKIPKQKKPWLIVLVGLILLAVLATAYFVLFNGSKTNTNSKSFYEYKPGETTAVAVKGSKPKRGITFTMPNVFRDIWTPASDKNQKAFINSISDPNNSKSSIAVARIAADSYNYISSDLPNDKFYKEISAQFALDPNSSQYQANLKNLYTIAKIAFPEKGMTIKIAGGKEFTNSYIREHAWQLDITATDPSGKTPDHTGKILWIGGSHNFYHFLVMAANKDWNGQSNTWQLVLNSIQIDQ